MAKTIQLVVEPMHVICIINTHREHDEEAAYCCCMECPVCYYIYGWLNVLHKCGALHVTEHTYSLG